MRIASAKGREMKAPFKYNLPNQTNDVMVNSRNFENPDSKPVHQNTICSAQIENPTAMFMDSFRGCDALFD
jgi:hypothetical protein